MSTVTFLLALAQTDLITHWHTGTHCEGAREELNYECLKFEDIFDFGPVKKADNFWDPRACGRGLVEDESAAGHHEDDGVAHSEGEGTGKISFLQNVSIFMCEALIISSRLYVVAGELPLELRDNVYNLMKKETNNSNRESNNAHHQPSETSIFTMGQNIERLGCLSVIQRKYLFCNL